MTSTLLEPQITLRPLAARIASDLPTMRVMVSNSYALRGKTPKGSYETRVYLASSEIRTTYVRRGGNPLQDKSLICRTDTGANGTFDAHVAAIKANENKLPWINREMERDSGDQIVTILPFGAGENSPRVIVRKSSRTRIVSMNVTGAHDLSPAEAKLLGEALVRACEITADDAD